MEGTRFVEVPSERLMGLIAEVGVKVTAHGGGLTETVQGREVVVDIVPAGAKTVLRVFTSLSRGADAVRGCGEDAVRFVIGHKGLDRAGKVRFQPLSKGRRIYRTAPTQLPQDERITAFLTRFQDALREAYIEARNWEACHFCGAPMQVRKNAATGQEFWGCTSYPACRGSRPKLNA